MIDTNLITKQTDPKFYQLDSLNGLHIQAYGCYFKSMTAWPQYDVGAILSQEQELKLWIDAIREHALVADSHGYLQLVNQARITSDAYLALGKTGVNAKVCSQVKYEYLPDASQNWTPFWYHAHTFVVVCNSTPSGGTHWRLCDHDKNVIYDPYPGLPLGPVIAYAYYLVEEV